MNTIYKYLVLSCFLSYSYLAIGQQTVFKTYYSIDSSDNGPSPIALEIPSGYIYMSDYAGYYGSFGLGMRKITKEGQNLQFKLIYPNDSFDVFVTSMSLIEPNKILITGRNYWRTQSQMNAFLLLIDTNFNIIRDKNDSFRGYTNEIYDEIFYDYNGNLCTILKEFTYYLSPDSMYFSIQKINTNDFSTTSMAEFRGYDPLQLIKTSDSGYLLYTYSPKYDKQYYTDPVILKFDKNWNKLWERNLGIYGELENGGYGITRMVELNQQYYCWTNSGKWDEIGYLYRLDKDGNLLNKWREKDSSWFQTLINRGKDIIAFGNMNYYYKGDWRIALHIFDSNYNILKQNYIGFREFYDTCSEPRDSTLYHMDATRTSDGGYLIFNWGSSYGARGKFQPFGSNLDILFKTDSCGYTQGDTCKLVPRIDSIVYNKVYLSLDELDYKVCGRRWHVEGKTFTTDKLTYSFSDTGTYTIGIWGFAGATTDSTSIQVRITRLDSCYSIKTDSCRMIGDTTFLKCNQIRYALNKTLSQYCTRHWLIEGNTYYQDTVTYTYPINGTYQASLIGMRGLTIDTVKISVKITCSSLIISTDKLEDIELYPNPVSSHIVIAGEAIAKSRNLNIRLTNLLGQEIPCQARNDGGGRISIDIKHLPRGIYLLTIVDKKGRILQQEKIQVQ